MDRRKFGGLLSTIRKQKNMTQKDLANILGVSNRAVSKWETGEGYPDVTTLPPLAKILEVSIDELLIGEKLEKSGIIESNVNPVFDEYIYESQRTHFDNQRLISYAILIIGIFVTIYTYNRYRGQLSTIWFAQAIALSFLAIGFKYYRNNYTLMKSSMAYNISYKDDAISKYLFRSNAIFYSLFLLLSEVLLVVGGMFQYLWIDYYKNHGTIYGQVEGGFGSRLAIDFRFSILLWGVIYIVLLVIGIISLKIKSVGPVTRN